MPYQMVMDEDTACPTEKSSLVPSLIGKHLMYTYGNGWSYEMYYKNENTLDYKVLSGMVGGRCVRDQPIHMRQLAPNEMLYMVSWTEPTGTSVSQVLDLQKLQVDTVIFFPNWVHQNPHKTICFQNDHLDSITSNRDQGPTYPIHVVNETAHIYFSEDCGIDNQQVILV
eukprot:c20908_g1_i1 orf=185-691(-)